MNNRLLIVFLLGFSSGLPLALVTSTLQAWFAASGMSIFATASLSLIGFPYAYRIVWGPLLDRYPLLSLGKRRSWILVMQIGLLIGFNAMAWLSPLQNPNLLTFIAFLLACLSATQDIAIDAHRAEFLLPQEYGLGASLAVIGYRLALLIAGGLALILANNVGWPVTYRLMGILMTVGIFATIMSTEPSTDNTITHKNFVATFTQPLKELFLRPNFTSLILFILFYKLGEAFTTTTSGIVMPFLIQGIGFSLDTIGYINKILGIASILIGGVVAGIFLTRWSLYRALLLFGLLQAVTNSLFLLLAIVGKNVLLFAVAVVCDNFAAGMGSTALVVLFMRTVNKQYTATQFSLLVAISTLPRIFSGPLAALLQMKLGWVGLYQIAFCLSLLFIPFLRKIKKDTHPSEENVSCKLWSLI